MCLSHVTHVHVYILPRHLIGINFKNSTYSGHSFMVSEASDFQTWADHVLEKSETDCHVQNRRRSQDCVYYSAQVNKHSTQTRK